MSQCRQCCPIFNLLISALSCPPFTMSAGYFGQREKMYLDDLHWGLITASHILHFHGIFDAYGHISVRNPDDPTSFFLSMSKAPALLSSAEDIVRVQSRR